MGKPVDSNVKRAEIMPVKTRVNKEVLDNFKDYCSYTGYPMNVMLETFMKQYVNGKFLLKSADILQWQDDNSELSTLSTTFNKEIYLDFKSVCMVNSFYVKHVLTAFMKKFKDENYTLEYVIEDD